MHNSNEILKEFLLESELFTEEEFRSLSESFKVDSIREIAMSVLKTIKEKLEDFDTTPIDRSRGDIKQMKELNSLQNSINQLETIIERSDDKVPEDLKRYLKEIIKSVMYINQYSAQFKEAYKDRKTLLILRYQSLVMAIFSSLSYLISVLIDFSSGDIQIKEKPEYEEISPLKTVMDFNRSVEKGDFRMLLKNMTTMNEYYIENNDKTSILEASDILSMVLNNLQNITGVSGDKVIDFFYKAAGVVTMILSLREIIYTFFKSKTKFNDILNTVQQFAGISNSGAGTIAKLSSFASKFTVDAEESTKLAKREIETENRDIISDIRNIPLRQQYEPVKEPEMASLPSQSSDNFDIGF
jgi:hypothetical protein